MQQKATLTSVGSVVLALLASQHHNLHMLLFAFGMSAAGMSFMTTFPMIRRVMLLMSLVMVGITLYQFSSPKRPASMRIMAALSVILTLGIMAWSVSEFGF